MKDLSVKYVSFIAMFAAFTAILFLQRGLSGQDVLAYLTFIFVVVYSVHRR